MRDLNIDGSRTVQPHLIALVVATCLLSGAPALAHHAQKVEAPRRAPIATDPVVTVAGYVHEIVIDDRVTGAERHARVLIADDGKRYRIADGLGPPLATGGTYILFGRANGAMLYVDNARITAGTGRNPLAARPVVTIDGHLRLGHADNFDGGPSVFFYAIDSVSQQRWLSLGITLEGLQNGMPARVTGRIADDGELLADRIILLGPPDERPKGPQAAPVTTSYIVIPIKFPTNASAPFTYNADPFTVASIDSAVFGAAPVGSAGEYYKEVSFGRQLLSGVVADNGSGGWLAANVATPAACDIGAIAAAAEAAAAARGYVVENYAGRVYIFSNNVPNCAWLGWAYVGQARSWAKETSSLLVIGHELGHNFGLWHAASLDCGPNVIEGPCTSSEYGDPFDIMGNQRAMHFNSAQKDTLGWLPAGTVALHKGGTTSYALTPVETAGGARYAIKVPAGPLRTYWIEYRQPLGFDSALSAFPNNGAQIRVESPFESICGGCADDTEFLDLTPATSAFTDGALVVGQSHVDSTYGITISTIAQGAADLTVTVAAPTRPSFADVPASHPSYADIETIYWYGITKGCATSPLMFCPTGTVSRAEMAVFIERAKRGAMFTGTASGAIFADVIAGYWAGGQIEQLYGDGITAGCATSPLRFCPDNKVSRAEMAIFLLRARFDTDYDPGAASGSVFSDVPKAYWAAAWIEKAYQLGMMPSCASGPLRFCPDSLVPRSEMATLLKSTFNLTTAPL